MRILYFAPVFPPEQSGGATHVYELAKEWVRLGHSVTVTKGFPCHPHGCIPEKYRGRLVAREELDGIEVLYTWLYAAPNVGRFRRTLSYITGALVPLIANLCRRKRYDVVIGTCPHIFLVVAAFLYSLITGTRYVFEVRDMWPQQIVDLGQIKNRFVIRMLEALELFLYRRSRMVVTVTRGVKRAIVSRGIDPHKVATIPNGVDCDFLKPVGAELRRQTRHELGLGEKFVVSYFGTFGLSQGLSTVLGAAEVLRSERDVIFVLAGDGAERGKLIERKERSRLDNVMILSSQPRERMPALYGISDVGLVPLRKLPLFRHTVPSKIFEFLACGVPVILGVEGEARELLEESGAGIAVPPEDHVALADAIRAVRNCPEMRREMSQRGIEWVRTHYDRKALAANFIGLLAERLAMRHS